MEETQLMPQTFKQWCRVRHFDKNAIGDFACDWLTDPEAPRATRMRDVVDHLEDQGACQGAIDAGRRAWMAYNREHPGLMHPQRHSDGAAF